METLENFSDPMLSAAALVNTCGSISPNFMHNGNFGPMTNVFNQQQFVGATATQLDEARFLSGDDVNCNGGPTVQQVLLNDHTHPATSDSYMVGNYSIHIKYEYDDTKSLSPAASPLITQAHCGNEPIQVRGNIERVYPIFSIISSTIHIRMVIKWIKCRSRTHILFIKLN
jgi:hypothetical protein